MARSASLNVYLGSKLVGIYARKADGATVFRYHDSWLNSELAFPISLSLPLSSRERTGLVVERVFDGLLPDNSDIREALAARTGAESDGVFDLLAELGRDCVGALRFLRTGEEAESPMAMRSRPLSEADITQRIAGLIQRPLGVATGVSEGEEFRISLGGAQDKTALLRIDNAWRLPLGSTPTSHIFKPAMGILRDGISLADSPWNEWFCLKLCAGFGLASARAEIEHYDGKPVLVVKRFDRQWRDGVLYRLPQEDLCQALGVAPARKYESHGGPGIRHILDLLHQASTPHADRLAFLKSQIVYWLLSAPDGHAKNFSIFLRPDGFSLTPIYDVMSAAPYHPKLAARKIKLAMALGNNRHYRVHTILPRHFYQTAQAAGIAKADVEILFDDLEKASDGALQDATVAAERAGMPARTRDAIVDTVRSHVRLFRLAPTVRAPVRSHASSDEEQSAPGLFS